MPQQKPTLGYWNIRGLGQPIRHLLHYLEVDYEEKSYSEPEKWFGDKETLGLPFPNLPYWIDGHTKVTESRAIMKYLCHTHKTELLGKSAAVQTKVDMVDNFMYDCLYSGLATVAYQYTEERHKKWVDEDEPRKLRYLNDFIKDNQWASGNDVTYVDFLTYEVLYFFKVFNPKCLDNFPKLKEYMDRFEKLPAIQKYMSTDSYLKGPCFSPMAIYKM